MHENEGERGQKEVRFEIGTTGHGGHMGKMGKMGEMGEMGAGEVAASAE
jgi:hypothetical protein